MPSASHPSKSATSALVIVATSSSSSSSSDAIVDDGKRARREPTSRFPTTLADLQQRNASLIDDNENEADPDNDTDVRNLYKTIKSLRVATLSISNRLASIEADSRFVETVAAHYGGGGGLPIIANERCGSWYIPPWRKAGSVYFKSTDGHHGQWAFSLRRLNLNLLAILGRQQQGKKNGGAAMIVDSTRRGKRVPDALAKTVAIWCAVVNAVLFPDYCHHRHHGRLRLDLWEDVGDSERSQIQARLPGWCDAFVGLGLDLGKLREDVRRPIRCVWAVNGEWDSEQEEYDDYDDDDDDGDDGKSTVLRGWKRGEWNLLVLCSASRVVRGAEMSQGGYIQGSGDDHEGWSRGLTPDMFWLNRKRLEGLGEEEMVAEIEQLVREDKESRQGYQQGGNYTCIEKVGTIYIGVGPVKKGAQGWDLVINCQGASDDDNDNDKKKVLTMNCRAGKLGSKDLREKLSLVQQGTDIATILDRKKQDCRILITCDSGKDLSIGVAVVLLCLFYSDDGKVSSSQPVSADKHLVKQRLSWITSSKPDANPSRATLQAVNSCLIERPN